LGNEVQVSHELVHLHVVDHLFEIRVAGREYELLPLVRRAVAASVLSVVSGVVDFWVISAIFIE